MDRIGALLEPLVFEPPKQMQKKEHFEKCLECGTMVKFTVGQYKRHCQTCNLPIVIPIKTMVNAGTTQKKEPKCRFCDDQGYMMRKVQMNGEIRKLYSRCFCPAGNRYKGWPNCGG